MGVDVIAGSANKVILGVVDSSFGVLRALLPGQTVQTGTNSGNGTSTAPRSGLSVTTGSSTSAGAGAGAGAGEADATVWGVRPGLGLLRRETGFSIAGLTVALPGGASKARGQSHPEEGQRELVEVSSRLPSLKSHLSGQDDHEKESEETEEGSEEEGSVQGSEDEEGEEGREDSEVEPTGEGDGEGEGDGVGEGEADAEEEEAHDTRSIRSFESMLSGGRAGRKTNAGTLSASGRPSGRRRLTDFTDRLTHGVAGMSRRVQGGDAAYRTATLTGRLPPPNRRFMECTEQDIRVSEVGELLREYQRLVEAVRSVGGFQE